MLGEAGGRLKHPREVLPARCRYLRNRTHARPAASRRGPGKTHVGGPFGPPDAEKMYSRVASGSPLQPLGSTKTIVRRPSALAQVLSSRGQPTLLGIHLEGMGSPTAIE